LFRSNISN